MISKLLTAPKLGGSRSAFYVVRLHHHRAALAISPCAEGLISMPVATTFENSASARFADSGEGRKQWRPR